MYDCLGLLVAACCDSSVFASILLLGLSHACGDVKHVKVSSMFVFQ